MKQFLCELLFICTVASPGARPVDELAYGNVLYDYFQDDYQAALLNVLVAQSRDFMGEDTVRFDLARGSFAFADGMYGYARQVFDAIPEGELTDIDTMRLAFHLAREYHRREDWQSMDEQLARIELGKTWLGRERQHPEVEYMRAELAVHRGQFEQAAGLYQQMAPEHPLRAYGLFNLGVALRQADRLDEAQRTFHTLTETPAYSSEAADLKQRAKLALALIARQQKQTTEAETVLEDLPAKGRYQDVAMAAYGGLAMDTQNYELAARIWMTLQEHDYWTPSTATARLGFPLSLEKLAAGGRRATTEMALVQYQAAEQSFETRLTNLTRLTEEATDPTWVRGLLEVFAVPLEQNEDGDVDEARVERMQALMQRWQAQLGHTDWLEWLATDKVHHALVQWRELNAMENWLDALPEQVDALQGVAVEQRRRTELARRMLVGDGLLARRTELEARSAELAEQFDALRYSDPVPERHWMIPLATPDERALLDELASMRLLFKHMNDRDRAKWSARLERLEGVVFYRIVDESAARLQQLAKAHGELQVLLADAGVRVARVQAAESHFEAGVGTDFMVFVDRANAITAQVNHAREGRERLLAGEIRARMQQEMQQVQQYLLVTRIAIARATDQLALNADGAGR